MRGRRGVCGPKQHCGHTGELAMPALSRDELVAKLRAFYDMPDDCNVAGRALDDEIAKSDFIIDELMDDACCIKHKKKS